MMVLFLVGLVSMILLRTLRKDYARYGKDDDLDDMVKKKKILIFEKKNLHFQERDLGDEYGWKQVHGDVFRSPTHPLLFSSLIGSGYQIATVTVLCITITIVGDLYTE